MTLGFVYESETDVAALDPPEIYDRLQAYKSSGLHNRAVAEAVAGAAPRRHCVASDGN